MVILLTGENSYEVARELEKLARDFDGVVTKVDGESLTLRELPDLLMGMTLFSEKRLVIMRDLSKNSALWQALPEWIERLSDDITLVLVDPRPDKRTRTYKALVQIADVRNFEAWSEKDTAKAEAWLRNEAKRHDFTLDGAASKQIVDRVGVDQWQLAQALEKLIVLGRADATTIESVIEMKPSESAFVVFEAALAGDREALQKSLAALRQTEDPYQLMGLLGSQAFGLATALGGAETTKALGIHPFVARKMTPLAKRLGKSGVRQIVEQLAEADELMKSSGGEPWVLIERALLMLRGGSR